MNADSVAASTYEDVTGSRILAGLIDVIILAVIYGIFVVVFGNSSGNGHSFSVSLNGVPSLLYFLVVIGYYLVMEVQTGAMLARKLWA